MNDIYDILNINIDLIRNFSLLANQSRNRQIDKVIEHNIRKLEEIEKIFHIDVVPAPIDIDEILNKVRWYARKEDKVDFSIRELRIVSYYMVKLQGDDISYNYAIDLLRNNWKNLYFRGLVYYVLSDWNTLYKKYRIKVCELIREKLSEYRDYNKRYCLLKDHADYFEENGPLRMAKLLLLKDMNLFNAPEIIGYKSSSFTFSFYSDVILYYLKEKKYDLKIVEAVLEKHDLDRTKKLIFANLVRIADKRGDEFYQTQICKLANKFLGDVTASLTWIPFIGATTEEVEMLRKAKELVNLWFTKKIIETFFEVCVQDESRKTFWLNYVAWINDFKIFGSTLIKEKLQADNRIGNMFKRFFVETNSRQSQNAALALCIRGKVLVEFSDVGRLYVYDALHLVVEKIINLEIESIEDLKCPGMNKLIDFQRNSWGGYSHFDIEDSGHMNHMGDWDIRLRRWIDEKLKNSSSFVSFTNQNNDVVIFQEKSIPIEKFVLKEPEERIDKKSTEHAKVMFQSENLFNEKKYRIVADENGFYIFNEKRGSYIPIKSFKNSGYVKGNISIKKLDAVDFYKIVYDDSGRLHKIGYIKKSGNCIILKEVLDSDKDEVIWVD